jgi:hypothetical protein
VLEQVRGRHQWGTPVRIIQRSGANGVTITPQKGATLYNLVGVVKRHVECP